MLWTALEDPDPVLIFENVMLYNMTGKLAADAGPVDIDKAAVRVRLRTRFMLFIFSPSLRFEPRNNSASGSTAPPKRDAFVIVEAAPPGRAESHGVGVPLTELSRLHCARPAGVMEHLFSAELEARVRAALLRRVAPRFTLALLKPSKANLPRLPRTSPSCWRVTPLRLVRSKRPPVYGAKPGKGR